MTKISLQNCTLEIPIFGSSSRLLKKKFLRNFGLKKKNENENIKHVKVLSELNIEFKENDRIGILGKNGSGKTSLLRLISGIYPPTYGKVKITGKMNTLLNLDVGFENEATGIENIEIYYATLNRKLTNNQLQKIIDLTDLGKFIHLPVKTYSSGMRLKLAFALTINFNCEILLLDEWLAVGDNQFREKSNKMLKEKISGIKILIFASHSIDMISKNCNKILILEEGQVSFFGPIEQGIKTYISEKKSRMFNYSKIN